MSLSSPVFWLILFGVEALLLLFVSLFIYWIRGVAQTRRDKQAMRQLIKRVRDKRNQRLDELRGQLGENLGIDGAKLEELAIRALQGEMYLYQKFAHVYAERQDASAGKFDIPMEELVSPYLSLKLESRQAAGAAVEDPDPGEISGEMSSDKESDVELEVLRRENRRLQGELHIAMDSIGRMLDEYSSMLAQRGLSPLLPGAHTPATTEQTTLAEPELAVEDDVPLASPDELPEGDDTVGAMDETDLLQEDAIADIDVSDEDMSVADVDAELFAVEEQPDDDEDALAVALSSEDVVAIETDVDELVDEDGLGGDEFDIDAILEASAPPPSKKVSDADVNSG